MNNITYIICDRNKENDCLFISFRNPKNGKEFSINMKNYPDYLKPVNHFDARHLVERDGTVMVNKQDKFRLLLPCLTCRCSFLGSKFYSEEYSQEDFESRDPNCICYAKPCTQYEFDRYMDKNFKDSNNSEIFRLLLEKLK